MHGFISSLNPTNKKDNLFDSLMARARAKRVHESGIKKRTFWIAERSMQGAGGRMQGAGSGCRMQGAGVRMHGHSGFSIESERTHHVHIHVYRAYSFETVRQQA